MRNFRVVLAETAKNISTTCPDLPLKKEIVRTVHDQSVNDRTLSEKFVWLSTADSWHRLLSRSDRSLAIDLPGQWIIVASLD